MPNNYWNTDRIMRLLFAVTGTVLVSGLLAYLADVLIPFGIAFLLAYMLDPLVCLLQKRVRSRGGAAILVLLGFLVLSLGTLVLLVPAIIRQMAHLRVLLSVAIEDASWWERILAYVPADWWGRLTQLFTQDKMISTLQTADFWTYVQAALAKLLPGVWGLFSGTARVLVWLVGASMVFMYLLFMLIDFGTLRNQLADMVPAAYRPQVFHFAQDFDRIMGQYFRAQILVSVILAAFFAIAFSIMGLPLGLPFGLLAGLLTLVPYLQLVSFPPALLLSLIYSLDTGMPFWQVALIVLAIYIVAQLLQDYVLVPRIMGRSLGLSPVAILLSLSVWGKLLGLFGMLLAIPFTCILLATWQNYRRNRAG
jgi:predicted PurR-regulated permease PerM